MGRRGTLVIHARRHTSLSYEPPVIQLYDQTVGHFNERATDVTPYLGFDVDADTQAANQYLQELEHFCHCVRTGETPLVTGRDGRHGVEVINATYRSHFRRGWVELPLRDTSELPKLFEVYRREQEEKRRRPDL